MTGAEQDSMTQRFMAALQQTEAERSPEPVSALFAEDGEATNLARQAPLTGADGVRRFWQDYLGVFGTVRSEFTHWHDTGSLGVMEWLSDGTLADGTPMRYRGVSIIEHDGARVRRFRTYYDSATFLPQGAKTAVAA